jgi:hypothetical protein
MKWQGMEQGPRRAWLKWREARDRQIETPRRNAGAVRMHKGNGNEAEEKAKAAPRRETATD